MAAPVPVIYPRELEVSSSTSFYIRCNDGKDSIKGYDIFFTLDGSKPNPLERGSNRSTIKYKTPFKLDAGRHQVKALSVASGRPRATPSGIANKFYEVTDKLRSRGGRNEYDNQHVSLQDPDIRTELQYEPEQSSEDSQEDSNFSEAAYLETRAKLRLKRDLEDYGNICELCRTPRTQDANGVYVTTCTLCGYRYPDLGSAEVREARAAAAQLTPEISRPGTGDRLHTIVPSPLASYTTVDAHGVSYAEGSTPHYFMDRDGTRQTVHAGSISQSESPGNTPLLRTRQIGHVSTSPFGDIDPVRANSPASRVHEKRPSSPATKGSFTSQYQRPNTTSMLQSNGQIAAAPEYKKCESCGTINPAHLPSCALCHHSLARVAVLGKHVPPQEVQETEGVKDACPNCTTVNNPESRFCQWCGFKYPPRHNNRQMIPLDIVDRVTTGGGDHSIMQQYTMLPDGTVAEVDTPVHEEPPLHWGYHLDTNLHQTSTSPSASKELRAGSPATTRAHSASSRAQKNAHESRVEKHFKSTASQTGLYFPSNKTLELEKMRMEQVIEGKKPERTIFVGDVSPGNGYWRQQIDHALTKLKAFARETPSFQTHMGRHRMGAVTGAQIREDGDQILLTISLDNKEIKAKKGSTKHVIAGVTYSANQSMQGTQTPMDDFVDEKGALPPLSTLTPVSKKTSSRAVEKKRLAKLTKSLFATLGPDGDSDALLDALDQGADVNGFNADRDRPLHVAAYHGRVEAIKFLIDAEADVNAAGGRGDTPLHAAVRGGHHQVREILSLLMEANARTDIQNIDNLTPCTLAGEHGKKDLVNWFGKKLSHATLSNMARSKIQT